MKILLDEQLAEAAALSLTPIVAADGHAVEHIATLGHAGADDDEIPTLCAELGFSALLSANVKDFGARKHYFAALLNAGVHVGVVRPGKGKFDLGGQVGLIAPNLAGLISKWHQPAPLLFSITQGGIRERSLEQLMEEIEGRLP